MGKPRRLPIRQENSLHIYEALRGAERDVGRRYRLTLGIETRCTFSP